MNSKLTLSLDSDAINGAKRFASEHGTSLSRLLESYFRKLSGELRSEKKASTPIVDDLSGALCAGSGEDLRELYTDHLLEKYR